MRPMSWKWGSQLTWTVDPNAPRLLAFFKTSRFCIRLSCVTTTPFGIPVDPEVYWRKATASAVGLVGSSLHVPSSFSKLYLSKSSELNTWTFMCDIADLWVHKM